MLFMVIERFRDRDAKAVYRRLGDQGRGAPEGLTYVGSWIEASFERCFQLMECDDARLLQQWVAFWSDLVEFEIVPVVPSADTRAAIESLLPGSGPAHPAGAGQHRRAGISAAMRVAEGAGQWPPR
jgi:hypothetical protein